VNKKLAVEMPRLLVKLMGVPERKKKLVLKALAFNGGFHEAGKNNESKVEALVTNIGVAVFQNFRFC
jgi:hypothetical protein